MKIEVELTDQEMIATLEKANAKLQSIKNQTNTQLLERFYEFAEMFEIIGAAIFIKDLKGIYVSVNKKWEALTHIKAEETIGCHDIDIFPESISKVFALEDQKVLHGGTASSSKGSFLLDSQTENLVSLRYPITNAEKKIIGICGIVTETSLQSTLEQRLAKLAQCMLTFTADHLLNINNLVALAGEEFQAACALYNKLENKQLCAIGQWNAPEGFQSVSAPEGHICFDVIQQGNDEVTILQHLDQSIYAQTDPSVGAFHLKSYIGVPVKSKGMTLGSLCLVYQYKFVPTTTDLDFFKLIAYAVSNEETRQDDELIISESDNKFSKLLMEIPSMAVQGINQEGRVISWTKTSEKFYGYSAQEAIGEYIWDLIVPDEKKNHVKDIIRTTFHQQRPSEEFEFQTIRKDGSKFWVMTSQTHVSLPRKESFLFSFDQDITDRKMAEAQIRESEENYRNLFNNAQVGLFKSDLITAKIIDCNDKLVEMSGYDSKEEMIATEIAMNNYVDPTAREKMLKEFAEFGFVNNFEAQFYRKNRSKFWLNFSFRLNKEKGWIEGVAVDISDQKTAQKALIESEASIKAIVESSLDSVWSVNTNYEVEYINEVFANSFFYAFGKKL
ncbi:MAG: PAS domain S-box protein, partial [Fluviicola sp.]|nr:PAS domain S-box protein [Fluviicola sp.]